jgi:hypothetical protein
VVPAPSSHAPNCLLGAVLASLEGRQKGCQNGWHWDLRAKTGSKTERTLIHAHFITECPCDTRWAAIGDGFGWT